MKFQSVLEAKISTLQIHRIRLILFLLFFPELLKNSKLCPRHLVMTLIITQLNYIFLQSFITRIIHRSHYFLLFYFPYITWYCQSHLSIYFIQKSIHFSFFMFLIKIWIKSFFLLLFFLQYFIHMQCVFEIDSFRRLFYFFDGWFFLLFILDF